MRKQLKEKRFESKQRARILEAAIKIFAQKGYKGTTIRALGRSAKVNSALIYYYYENKHNLFTESVRMILRGFLQRLYGQHHDFVDARDRLTYMVANFFEFVWLWTHMPNPKGLLPLMPYIFNVHGKFYEMTEDLVEYSMPYEEVIPVLIESGYDGYILSE